MAFIYRKRENTPILKRTISSKTTKVRELYVVSLYVPGTLHARAGHWGRTVKQVTRISIPKEFMKRLLLHKSQP